MISNDPLSALAIRSSNEDQIKEKVSRIIPNTAQQKQATAIELLDQVRFPTRVVSGNQYPHELLSHRQRGIICHCNRRVNTDFNCRNHQRPYDLPFSQQILDFKDCRRNRSGII